MKLLVFGLAAVLGSIALRRLLDAESGRLVYGDSPDAFPFPTRASRQGIDLDDEEQRRLWCQALDCSEEQLRAAVRSVGNSAEAVRRHILRRR